MKTYHNILKPINQYVLIALIVLITLLGFGLKANSSLAIEQNHTEIINHSSPAKLANHESDIVTNEKKK